VADRVVDTGQDARGRAQAVDLVMVGDMVIVASFLGSWSRWVVGVRLLHNHGRRPRVKEVSEGFGNFFVTVASARRRGKSDPVGLILFTVGWSLGWVLLWRLRSLPRPDSRVPPAERAPIAVIIPARDEGAALARLLPGLRDQLREHDELVVVDDGSVDDTAAVAGACGARVLGAPDLPDGWLGKPHACWVGARATSAATMAFVDADVRPAPDLLDRLVAESIHHPQAVVSVQPWHRTGRLVEQCSLVANVVTLMGSGAFTVVGDRLRPDVAFGPVLCMQRDAYERIGGHADPTIRTMHTEDIGLARAARDSRVFSGRPDTSFRMYPAGWRQLNDGWVRTIATGARSTRWWLTLAVGWWVAAIAGGWIAEPLVYPVCALQVWVLGRRAGSMSPITALLYPIAVAVFVWFFARSLVAVVLRRDVRWKRRAVAAR